MATTLKRMGLRGLGRCSTGILRGSLVWSRCILSKTVNWAGFGGVKTKAQKGRGCSKLKFRRVFVIPSSSRFFFRAGAGGQDAEGGFQDVPLHLQMQDFVAQGLVLGPELADRVERLGGCFFRRGGRIFPLPSPQVGRAEAQFGGNL